MLGDVGTRHAESAYAFVIGHGMPCPYHASAPASCVGSVFRSVVQRYGTKMAENDLW